MSAAASPGQRDRFGNLHRPDRGRAHTVAVTDTDVAGNTANATLTFTLDTTIATPTIALAHDTGSSNSDRITNDPSIAVSAAAADVSRSFTVDNGVASASYIAPTVDGQHTVVVTDTDVAGNTASASLTFTLDTTIATPTIALAHDTGSSNSDKITNDPSIAVSAAAADVSRSFTVDNGTPSLSYVAPTADGQHTVVVTDTDTAGNTANAVLTFTLDRTIATPTVALTHDTGSSAPTTSPATRRLRLTQPPPMSAAPSRWTTERRRRATAPRPRTGCTRW